MISRTDIHEFNIVGALGPVLDELFLGVLIIDHNGRIVYYNKRMGALDELTPEEAIGYKINEVYSVRDENSPSMIALATRRPVKELLMHYKTARRRQISSINHAFPLIYRGELYGAICLVTDISSLTRQIIETASDNGKKLPKHEQDREEKEISFEAIIGKNPLFREAVDVAKLAAMGPSPVMLIGETGTGKDMFARAIHNYGARADKNFMAINCSAIPEGLLEGILFGTSKGAFTGALEKVGLLEHASGGTVFLDEINSMPLLLQAKLLRVMQDQRVRRVGGLSEKKINLRIISAINISPLKALADKSLRSDLYYRLGVVQVMIPPLRERPEDIPPLVEYFVETVGRRLQKKALGASLTIMNSLKRRPWPGNVRELEHTIESAMNFLSNGEQLAHRHLKRACRNLDKAMTPEPENKRPPLGAENLPWRRLATTTLKESLEAMEQHRLIEALKDHKGQLNRAAAELGLSPQLMAYKIKKYKLDKGMFR